MMTAQKILKSKKFQSKKSDIKLEVLENGYVFLTTIYSQGNLVIGKPENERIRLIEEAIKYARKIVNKEKKK